MDLNKFYATVAIDLYKYVFEENASQLDSLRGNPNKVLDLIDEFSKTHKRLMNVGEFKGAFILNEIAKVEPKIMVELGGFMGYSAIKFGALVGQLGGKYFSFELSQEYANTATKLIDLAGLSDVVEIIIGPTNKTLPHFADYLESRKIAINDSRPIDFVFIDHEKSLYTPDLRILESLNYIGVGSVIAADNLIIPGAPEYHAYVNSTPQEKNEYNSATPNPQDESYIGRWNIVYETELHKIENTDDGVELTKLVQYLNT